MSTSSNMTSIRSKGASRSTPNSPVSYFNSPTTPSEGTWSPALSSSSFMSSGGSGERIFPIASAVQSTEKRANPSPAGSVVNAPMGSPKDSPMASTSSKQRHTNFDSHVSYFSHRSHDSPSGQSSPTGSSLSSAATPRSSQQSAERQPFARSSPTTPYADDPVYVAPNEDEIIERAIAAKEALDRQPVATPTLEVLMTVRFEHQETPEGHMIVTGHEGELTRCEDEPIHVPGAIQAWGVLMALQLGDDGRFKVVQVSENSGHILGLPPTFLFNLDCLTECLEEDEAEILREASQMIPANSSDLTDSGPHHFELAGSGIPGTGIDGPDSVNEWVCWCTIHAPSPSERPNLLIVEFELQDDPLNPAVTTSREPLRDDERTGLNGEPYEPTEEDLRESTINSARPLRKRLHSKRRVTANLTGSDVFQTLNQIQDQLARAADLPTFLKIVVGVIQDLTGYHRVMIYQFDEQWNGQVVAEMVDWTKTRDLFRGLHFPATDIPAQARELYKLNKFRQLYDRDQPTARMVCRDRSELDFPVDMTHVALRAMSPIHIKYLANMGVRASGSISIVAFGSLWGLISCHSYGRYGQRMTTPQRQLCRVLGGDISRNIERLSYASRLHSRRLINTVSTNSNPSGYIVAKAEDLLTLFDAEFGCLSIGDEAKLLGPLENSQEVLAVLDYLRRQSFQSIQSTQDIAVDFPEIKCPGGFKLVAGFLLVPLSQAGRDFIVFFRQGQVKHIHWAGNPYDKIIKENAENHIDLQPRKSFKLWSETVIGKCRAWTDDQLETASVLCLVYGKFINVWRQKEVAMKSNQLTNLLLSNASHEVRTPLNAIVNYLEMALDGPLDTDTRDALTKSYSASKALIHVINDLLDLTRAEAGKDLYLQDPFDLPAVFDEAVSVHRNEAQRRGLQFELRCYTPDGPTTVLGDRARFKQVLANVVSNAVKHTKQGSVLVEWGEAPASADQAVVEAGALHNYSVRATVSDTGVGMSTSKLDSLFRQFEEVDGFDGSSPNEEKELPSLGLGLAVVARIVKNLGGQLRVDSKEGSGSTFTVILPFRLPDDSHNEPSSSPSMRRKSSVDSQKSQRSGISRAGSFRSNASSGGHSEIASLVEAFNSNPMEAVVARSSNSTHDGITAADRSTPSVSLASPRISSTPGTPPLGSQSISSQNHDGFAVEGSRVPLRSIRVPDDSVDTGYLDKAARLAHHRKPSLKAGSSLPTPPDSPAQTPGESPTKSPSDPKQVGAWQPVSPSNTTIAQRRRSSAPSLNDEPMRVLVVEDDPINRAILQKKLTKEGHDVVLSFHGEEAVQEVEKDPSFDVILMDIQMPICDGFTATKRIRDLESELPPGRPVPASQRLLGRIPIVAVSASLLEKQHIELLDGGMDGWMLKPINFERMRTILIGVRNSSDRKNEMYRPGHWEIGGWFS